MKNFEVKNIKCQNCANTIKNYFEDEFGKVDVDVEKGIVSLNLDDDKIQYFCDEMKDLGFEVLKEIK
ncbi:heavy metal transport/detoxification protein [Campylobacter ureolyticus]|uniref:heavy-metal-associated domain-containing protein n=1 Tax=Campylobacter ureolyticus TaxID=827 RepID=UPI0022B39003|nr:heavy metal transport/detoxification protein [Campylobacter ureolyticus]MCZ6186455.1 heavy metal transport/detoxification protein [Campylobacter ureolyticus]